MALGTTALIAASIGSTAISTGLSFIQADKQRREQRKAEAAAARFTADARKKLKINFAEQLSIQKEPYQLAREAGLSTAASAIQAGQESDRGAEATAGKITMAQNLAQADVRAQMGKELMDIEKQIADENSRLRDLDVQLDLGEVEGAQLAARDAQEAADQAKYQGVQGALSLFQQVNALGSLYGENNKVTNFSKEGGQVSYSQRPDMTTIDTSGGMNPIDARTNPDLMTNAFDFQYNPFALGNYQGLRR